MKRTIFIWFMLACLSMALLCALAEVEPSVDAATAKAVALEHAGLAEGDVAALAVALDREDGRKVYAVEFWKDATEYDYDVDAGTGELVSFDVETKGGTPPQMGEAAISPESALNAALAEAGVSAADATIREGALKYRDGAAKYKFEFVAGGMEYEVEIDAADGALLECDIEAQDD